MATYPAISSRTSMSSRRARAKPATQILYRKNERLPGIASRSRSCILVGIVYAGLRITVSYFCLNCVLYIVEMALSEILFGTMRQKAQMGWRSATPCFHSRFARKYDFHKEAVNFRVSPFSILRKLTRDPAPVFLNDAAGDLHTPSGRDNI